MISEPVKLYDSGFSQTKTYMHQYVDSPNGQMYAFRLFTGPDQPKNRRSYASPCEIWMCQRDLSSPTKLFTSPKGESGHGSDVITWVSDDLIYYAGISYQLSTQRIRWQFHGDSASLPLSKAEPVHSQKLYVAIRGNYEPGDPPLSRDDVPQKGFYWIDPSSPSLPELHLVSDMRHLVGHYGGDWKHAEATYIYHSPDDTKLFVVLYDATTTREYAFVLAPDGSVIHYLGIHRGRQCTNGHVLWFDDSTLMAGNNKPGFFQLDGTRIETLPSKGRHVSLSPDKKYWVADMDDQSDVRLYEFGSDQYQRINGDVQYFGDFHSSFSRDGRYVFFQGKHPGEEIPSVYRVELKKRVP